MHLSIGCSQSEARCALLAWGAMDGRAGLRSLDRPSEATVGQGDEPAPTGSALPYASAVLIAATHRDAMPVRFLHRRRGAGDA